MVDATVVANRLLELAAECGRALTPMQLLKLVYIAHGWMLGLYGRPLIRDEVQAWQYGPVIPTLYNAIRNFRSSPVQGPLQTRSGEALGEQERDLVKQVFNVYGALTGPALSRLTHAQGTPWKAVWQPDCFGISISNDLIADHYARLGKERDAAP